MVPLAVVIGLLLSLIFLLDAQAETFTSISCQNESDCSFLGPSYRCFNGQFCIKSTVTGCLHGKDNSLPIRVCNSNDSEELVQMGLCRIPKTEAMEIRLYSFDWESSMFQTWILQILLSEILDVPVSVETGNAHIDFSFYAPEEAKNAVVYSEFSTIERSFLNAHIYGDCRLSEKKVLARYETCAHFVPEVRFSAIEETGIRSEETGEIVQTRIAEPMEPAGGFGEQGLYIPKFTAQRDPSLISYFGMTGDENRQKLADTFLRPTRWSDYCSLISPNQCKDADEVATRAPIDKLEEDRFFVPGLYTGYFRSTDKNDCDANPSSCTGHVADYTCGLYSPVENQIFHLGIALEGDGAFTKFGYDLSELPEIWHAANATKANVLMYWTKPTLLAQEYAGTDAEFTKVAFPAPSQDCLDAGKDATKCLLQKTDSFGDPKAVCDDPPFQLQKATATALYDLLIDGVPEAIQSPAYAVLKAYTLPEMELSRFLKDLKSYNDPRHAVCDWVYDNMDTLQRFIPPTYPRVQEDREETALQYASVALGILSSILVIWTSLKVFLNRKKSIIRLAQVEFLGLVLVGSLLTAIGAIIGSLPRSDSICMAEIWLIYLGYSLSLVPQIVKVAAINRLMSAARRYQRLRLNLKNLYIAVTAVSLLVVVYLVLWTLLDPPQKHTNYTLTDSLTESGETIVLASYSCGSDMDFWEFVAIAWNALLLVSAVVLAIQSRNVVQEFNESHTLGILIYTNFVFLVSRGFTYYLERILDPSIILRCRSIIYSLDVIATLAVYFWPKLFRSEKKERDFSSLRAGSSHSAQFSIALPTTKPTFTTMSNHPLVRFLTSISNITFNPNEDDPVSFDEAAVGDVDSTDDQSFAVSVDTPPKNDDVPYVRKLEMTIVGLEAEIKGLRKRVRHVQFDTLNAVGEPPSPTSSSRKLDKDSLKRDSMQSLNISQQVRPLNGNDKIPSPMPSSSSSSEKVSLSDQMPYSSWSDQEASSVSSMPPQTSSESVRDSEVSLPEKVSSVDHEASLSSMPPLTSWNSSSESIGDSEGSFSEQSGPTIGTAAPPRMPSRRPSVPSESSSLNRESLLSDGSIYSIAEKDEEC